MNRISVIVADDNERMRGMLAVMLEEHFSVRDAVANGKELIGTAIARRPDVIVADVWMPGLNGLEAMDVLRRRGQTTPFVMVSGDRTVVRQCMAAGAVAFVCKTDLLRDLVPAVLAAFAGHTYLSVSVRGDRD